MSHSNRGRLTVDTKGNWKLFTNTLPAGSQPLGTVSRGEEGEGALVRIQATGLYVQVNAGMLRSLDQRKIVAAIRAAESSP